MGPYDHISFYSGWPLIVHTPMNIGQGHAPGGYLLHVRSDTNAEQTALREGMDPYMAVPVISSTRYSKIVHLGLMLLWLSSDACHSLRGAKLEACCQENKKFRGEAAIC